MTQLVLMNENKKLLDVLMLLGLHVAYTIQKHIENFL
jgi:hypothetical protein